MIRHFIDAFSFEDESPTIDNALHIIRGKVFKELVMSKEEESKWGEQTEHTVACFNLAMDVGDGESDEEDPRYVDIEEEEEGEREV